MLRHSLLLYRDDQPGGDALPRFDNDAWLSYIPIRLPETINAYQRLPPGAAAVLINQAHTDPDLAMPVGASELRIVEAIDGVRTVGEIVQKLSHSGVSTQRKLRQLAQRLFERLWRFDQVVFDSSNVSHLSGSALPHPDRDRRGVWD
jgi:hypothetical protein